MARELGCGYRFLVVPLALTLWVTFYLKNLQPPASASPDLPKNPPTFAGLDVRRSPSCMFAGRPDGSRACAARVDRSVAAKEVSSFESRPPLNCTAFINTRKYAPGCHLGEVANVETLMGMNARTHAVAGALSGKGQAAATAAVRPKASHRTRKGGILVYELLVTGVGGSGTNLAASALKQHASVLLGHESFAGVGSSSWIHAVNDAVVGLRYPFPRKGPNPTRHIFPESSPRFRTVVHQVRCPTGNMAALTTHNNFSREFLWHAAGIDPTEPDACLWGARVWLHWNRHVETYADHRVRVEDFSTPFQDLAGHICALSPGLRCKGPAARLRLVVGAGLDDTQMASSSTSRVAQQAPPLQTSWLAAAAGALGFESGGVKGHHRDHGKCSFDDMAAKDPSLAADVLRLAKRYGYRSSPKCDLGSAEAAALEEWEAQT
jgi:hypothetical protein